MRIEIFALCDAAADYHGRLNILGTFDTIWVKETPAVHRQCAIALRLRFSRVEEGEHKIRIDVIDEDGSAIIPSLNASAKVNFGERIEGSITANMILNIQGLKLQKYGEYSIDLSVDGRQETSLPLYVKKPREVA